MNTSPAATITSIFRYPVKGLTPERLDQVVLERGQTLPFDRAFAIEAGARQFDPAAPRHLPKTAFIMLMRHARLAKLDTDFDVDSKRLRIRRDGATVAEAVLDDPVGRKVIEQFFAGYMGSEVQGAPRVVSAPGHNFTDRPEKCVSIINLATVRDVERMAGRPVDPLRFRANVYVDGLAAWAEFNWVGIQLAVDDVRLRGIARISRCAATNVEPSTGERNLQIPGLLRQTVGHTDCGIYARIEVGGKIERGSVITPLGDTGAQTPPPP